MQTRPYLQWIQSSIGSLRQLYTTDQRRRQQWAQVSANSRRGHYTAALVSQDWERLASRARAELRARRSSLEKMRRRQARIAKLLEDIPRMETAWNAVRPQVDSSYRSPELRQAVEAELERNGHSGEALSDLMERWDERSTPDLSSYFKQSVRQARVHLDQTALRHLAAFMGASLALAVARFNLVPLDLIVDPGEVEQNCRQATDEIEGMERSLHQALRVADRFAAWGWAESISTRSAEILFSTVLPGAAAVADHQKAALCCGETIQVLLRGISLGRYVSWLALWPPEHPDWQSWVSAAQKTAFSSKAIFPRRLAISTLSRNGTQYDGRELTVEGRIGPVQITHRAGKAISTAQVNDRRGKQVWVNLPYIKLDSGGIVEGAWVRLGGVWQAHSEEVDGPALQVKRFRYSDLGKESWSDWATRAIRPVYIPVPQGLQAEWSWVRGTDGPGNQIRYQTWFEAGEKSG